MRVNSKLRRCSGGEREARHRADQGKQPGICAKLKVRELFG
jgi:hypothetical protein